MSSPIPQNRIPPSTPSSRTRLRLALAVLVLVAVAGYAVWWNWPPAAPDQTGGVAAAAQAAAAKECLQAWQQALNHGDWQEANRQEDRLVALGDAAVPGLVAEFSGPEDMEDLWIRRQRSAATLGRINTPAAVDALLKLQPRCADSAVRGQVLLALANTSAVDQAKVESILETTFTDPNETEEIRSSMATLIAKRGNPDALQRLCARAKTPPDRDPQAGAWAIAGLGFAPAAAEPLVGTVLQNILQLDPDVKRRSLAAEALGHRTNAAVDTILISVAGADKAPAVRLAAVQAIGRRPPTIEGELTLVQVLKNDLDPGVRAVAAQALGRPGAADNLAKLQEAVQADTPVYVQLKIVESIEQIGGASAASALQALLEAHPEPASGSSLPLPVAVRSAVKSALQRIQTQQPPEAPRQDRF